MHLHSPTCVGLRYGHPGKHTRAFLGRSSGDAPWPKPQLPIQLDNHLSLCVPHALNPERCRNVDLPGIGYALQPRLSSRLTLGGRTCPRNPWVYGGRYFRPASRYSCLHSHWPELHLALPHGFAALATLSYRTRRMRARGFGMWFDRQSFSARHRSMSQLLRTV